MIARRLNLHISDRFTLGNLSECFCVRGVFCPPFLGLKSAAPRFDFIVSLLIYVNVKVRKLLMNSYLVSN